MRLGIPAALALAACNAATTQRHAPPAGEGPDATVGEVDARGEAPACTEVDDGAPLEIGAAPTADDYALAVTAASASPTSWGAAGNEAVILEVSTRRRGLIGHLVLHQGQTVATYGMHVGALLPGERVGVKVSALSAPNAVRRACIGPALLASAHDLGAAGEGLVHAPEYRWPVAKRFDDLPVVVGWSKAYRAYQTLFTNENGGTVKLCGGGAAGVQADIGRWGRAADIEASFTYAGASPTWQRCTGPATFADNPPPLEGQHPILYYGNGHNRLFESRAGYGDTCGAGAPEAADGDLAGWNTADPDPSPAGDAGQVIILRPLPVDLDALGYADFPGRREAMQDRYAPWAYRLTALELDREHKIDGERTLPMNRYLYVDVRVDDVEGTGDSFCTSQVAGGFALRAITTRGTTLDGPRITADYADDGGHDWKRIAIPLPAGVGARDIARFQLASFDSDGVFVTGIGDAFVVEPAGPNGATIDYVRTGETPLALYVDGDTRTCTAGTNHDGPGGTAYTCVGPAAEIAK